MRKTLSCGWWTMALAAMLTVSGCKKQPVAAPAGASETKSVTVTSAPAARTANLGFAAHLPASTEVYISTINLPAHTAALKETNYFKDITAFMDDRVPAPSAATPPPAAGGTPPKAPAKPMPKSLANLAGNDFFISLGKGSAKALSALQKFSAMYTEFTYQTMMSGVKPGAPAAAAGPKNPMITALLSDPEMMKRVTDALVAVELPPIMIGIRSDKPEEVIKELLPEAFLATVRQKARVSQVTTNLSGSFTLIEGTGRDLINDEMKKFLLGMLPPEAVTVKPVLESALMALQAKTFAFSYGTAAGHVIVTMGSTRPDLQFVTDPATSLAGRPEFSVLNPFQGKNLAAVAYIEGTALQSLQQPEPIQPMVRGLLAGLKQSPVFSGMATVLEPKAAALAPLERKMHEVPFTTLVGVAWWDKGLHVEFDGGLSPKGLEGSKQLKFASLVNDHDVVLATDYHGDPQSSAILRTYVEAWADLLRTAGLELAKANLFGPEGGKMSSWVDLEIVPQLVALYNASKTMYGKALGNEHAWVIDLGGRMPAMPGLPPPDAKNETKMLRLVAVDDVVDRKLIGDSWAQMNTSLNGVAKAFPMLGGQGLPPPEASSKSGTTFYNYQLPFESDDLTLCSSVSDKVFMLGTSKSLQEDLAARLLRAAPSTDTPTMLWRVSWPNVRAAIKGFSPAAPAATAADNMKAVSKWMGPLGEMRGRIWIEAGHVRNSLSWDLKDTTKFD